jgi:hypothetical protein
MQLWRHASLRRFAASVILLAAIALVHQGAVTAVSQAAAAIGLMPEPAVKLSEIVHYHGNLARHVHTHDGDQIGHVHDPVGIDFDGSDSRVSAAVFALGVASVIVPVAASCPLTFARAARIALPLSNRLTGIDPEALSRPPSTPSIV